MNRIQFRYNQAQLEELDDETLDDDVWTFLTVPFASANVMFVQLISCGTPLLCSFFFL